MGKLPFGGAIGWLAVPHIEYAIASDEGKKAIRESTKRRAYKQKPKGLFRKRKVGIKEYNKRMNKNKDKKYSNLVRSPANYKLEND